MSCGGRSVCFCSQRGGTASIRRYEDRDVCENRAGQVVMENDGDFVNVMLPHI
jgi:hypothetical protein